MDRRDFLVTLLAGLTAPAGLPAEGGRPFRIRTITAGVTLALDRWQRQLREAAGFLTAAREGFQAAGYEVQTLRIATQPLPELLEDWRSASGIRLVSELDELCQEESLVLCVGPVIASDRYDPELAGWATELIAANGGVCFSVSIASEGGGIHPGAIRSAAETIEALGRTSEGGEGNFRFAATAHCPPGTPFFPAAWHRGEPAFALGLETPRLLLSAVESPADESSPAGRIAGALSAALAPVEALARSIAGRTGRSYRGIDASPAPGPDASIGRVIETLAGSPFGSASTLRACSTITRALAGLEVETCGYSGLMLPVLEDEVLARRAIEGRYGISELLLYSSVCGTGLDVVPLPGDSSVESLAAVIGDVAALSDRYAKPLSARLFPIPGKAAGDAVSFDNPFLTDSVVLPID